MHADRQERKLANEICLNQLFNISCLDRYCSPCTLLYANSKAIVQAASWAAYYLQAA
jgi:hypothetical protein